MFELLFWLLPVLLAAGVASYLLTAWLVHRLPPRLLDLPNERSSHRRPVPRGGGLAIATVVLAGATLHGLIADRVSAMAPYLVGGGLVAAISLFDDFRSRSIGLRLAVHAAAAFIALRYYTDMRGLPLWFGGPEWLLPPLTVLWIVGLTNAYNFMDGIDGLAAAQATIAGTAWCLLGVVFGSAEVALIGGLAAGAASGFFAHNRAPARIFMGDVGSAFLGYTFAVIPLVFGPHPGVWLAALCIVGVFVFDAAFTFMRRLLRGEPVLRPHRSHLYQRLVLTGRSHASVTRLYATLASLLAIAGVAVVFGGSHWLLIALLLTLAAGVSLWLHVRAQERQFPREAPQA